MENWTIAISFTNPAEANIAQGYLESNGIQTFLKDEMTVQVNYFYSNAIGGVKILVKESDFEQSIQLLKSGGYLIDHDSEGDFKIESVRIRNAAYRKICPFCKSENIAINKKANVFLVPVYLILGVIFPVYQSSYKCFDCWKEWKFR